MIRLTIKLIPTAANKIKQTKKIKIAKIINLADNPLLIGAPLDFG